MKSLNLPTFTGFLPVRLHEIIRAEAVNNYTKFYLSQGKEILVAKTLKYFEQIFADDGFVRIHKSHLINMTQVSEYIHNKSWVVVMKDKSRIPLARRKQRDFLAKVQKGLTVP